MKKVSLFATIIATAVVTGGITAFAVTKSGIHDGGKAYSASTPGPAAHFTSYEPQKYPDLTYAAENAVKGVVRIEVTQEVQSRQRGGGGMSPFDFFFGIPEGYQQQPQQQPREAVTGGGSGVIISPDGYIVTNNHVVKDATKLRVILEDNRFFDAKVIGTDPSSDIALIKIEASNLPMLPFGNSDDLRLGEWVLAIGSPYGLQSTITAGIVSAKARDLGVSGGKNSLESFIQTDAAVNQGNSGGALVNAAGELVGVNTIITSPNGSFIGYSFAVPSTIVKKVATDLKELGTVNRAQLGIMFSAVDNYFLENTGKEKGITEKGGLYVAEVLDGGAASAAGIKEGDIITEFNGVKVNDADRLRMEVAKLRADDKVKVIVKRGGEVKQFDVVLRNSVDNANVSVAAGSLGGKFIDIDKQDAGDLRIAGGVLVTSVDQNGILAKAGIRRGYIITHINGKQIVSADDLGRITEKIASIKGINNEGRSFTYSVK